MKTSKASAPQLQRRLSSKKIITLYHAFLRSLHDYSRDDLPKLAIRSAVNEKLIAILSFRPPASHYKADK